MNIDDDLSQRLGATMETLNARIARLSMSLGLSLNDRAVVDSLLSAPAFAPVPVERRKQPASAGTHAGMGSERRHSFKREELRGLLIMRYQLETTSVTQNGLEVTRHALLQVEDHMEKLGFKPGVDGLSLDNIFTSK